MPSIGNYYIFDIGLATSYGKERDSGAYSAQLLDEVTVTAARQVMSGRSFGKSFGGIVKIEDHVTIDIPQFAVNSLDVGQKGLLRTAEVFTMRGYDSKGTELGTSSLKLRSLADFDSMSLDLGSSAPTDAELSFANSYFNLGDYATFSWGIADGAYAKGEYIGPEGLKYSSSCQEELGSTAEVGATWFAATGVGLKIAYANEGYALSKAADITGGGGLSVGDDVGPDSGVLSSAGTGAKAYLNTGTNWVIKF